MITLHEKEMLRELAKKYMELAALEVNEERRQRCKCINNHIRVRPPVWINEIPWHEMNIDGQLDLHCEDPFARNMEWFFRSNLFRWKYIQADMVLEPFYRIYKSSKCSDIGVSIQEDILSTDLENNIVSHSYEDMLDTQEKLEKLHLPVVTAFPEIDAAKKEAAEDVLGDIMPVRLSGDHACFQPWDMLSELRGVEPLMCDLIEVPEFIHATMKKLTAIGLSKLEQQEKLGLLDQEPSTLHCTPPFVDGLPACEDPTHPKLSNVWFRGAAQIFGSVSPAMFEEFELQYIQPLAERCGYTYYGCCEPLDNFIPLLKRIKNLRKLGVSPWANPEKCAEQIGSDYAYARKPNPAMVAIQSDPDTIREEIRRTLIACEKNHCAAEFVLKDISTVSHHPENLIIWNDVVQKTIDDFYQD